MTDTVSGRVPAEPGAIAYGDGAGQAVSAHAGDAPLRWLPTWEDVRPLTNSRIVILYEDGSGAILGFWDGEQLWDSDGDEYGWPNDVARLWTYLPHGFDLWCENRGLDHVTFPRDSDQNPKCGDALAAPSRSDASAGRATASPNTAPETPNA